MTHSPTGAGAERSDTVQRTVAWVPDLLDLHVHAPERYPHLLESVARNERTGRYDILFALPGETLRLDAMAPGTAFLRDLDECWRRERLEPGLADLPFRGGWFLYLGYELAGEVEPSLSLPAGAEAAPVALAQRCHGAVIRDHQTGECRVVVEAGHARHLDQLLADLATAPPASASPWRLDALHEDDPERYLDGVARVKDYIVEGDVFQVNLSRAWSGQRPAEATPAALYQALRRHNPGPFAGLATWDDQAVISSSPERLVRTAGSRVETRPIAGTLARDQGADPVRIQSELMEHPKERAEHVMLIDLERNDLGRICRPGSVVVDELMALESYAHVHHIVSNVAGELRPGVTPGEVIRAVFPGGTITGCPKVRCMEIIAELEAEPRGAYTGSMGYLNRDGDMDLNILIRTITTRGSQLRLRAGAGVVADSDPQRELDETRAKARGLLRALE